MVALKIAKRIVVAVVGGTVLLLGVIMLVTPGPAFVVIPAGLAILAIEFTWARHWLHKAKEFIAQKTNGGNGKDASGSSPIPGVDSPVQPGKKTAS